MEQGRNDDGYVDFVRASLPRLHRLAFALTSGHDDSWDLTQECLVRVGLRWRHLDDRDPYAYARATMINLDRNRRRSLAARLRAHRAYASLARSRSTETTFQDSGLEPWLDTCLAALPRQQRVVVVLRYLEDMTLTEVATTTALAPSTVKTHLQRAMTSIRAAAIRAGARSRS